MIGDRTGDRAGATQRRNAHARQLEEELLEREGLVSLGTMLDQQLRA